MVNMATSSRSRIGRPRGPATVLLPVKVRPDLRQRFKVRAAQEGLTYAQMIERWLDADDAKLARQRRQQVHPLHRPDEPRSAYPSGAGGGGGVGHPAFTTATTNGAGGGGGGAR